MCARMSVMILIPKTDLPSPEAAVTITVGDLIKLRSNKSKSEHLTVGR